MTTNKPQDATLTASEYEIFLEASKLQAQQPGQSFLSEVARMWPATDTAIQTLPDQTLWMNRYLTKRVLGQGGFGIVYLAEDLSLHRLVALKIARPEVLAKPEWLKRFQREAITAASLDHPNIVAVFDAGQQDGVGYMTCAYCPGIDLGKWLAQRQGRVPANEAAGFLRKIAQAVAYLHVRGLVHRDLKPANILLTQDDISKSDLHTVVVPQSLSQATPRLTDFGLSQFVNIKQERLIAGTPSYMAPEQAEINSPVGPPVDVFALGAILYELLTGQPYRNAATNLKQLALPTQHNTFTDNLTQGIPDALLAIVQKCVQTSPQDRYADAGELVAALDEYFGVIAPRDRQRWESRLSLVFLAGLLVMLPFAYLYFGQQPSNVTRPGNTAKFNPVQYALDLKQAHEAYQRKDYDFGLQLLNRYASPTLAKHRGFTWGYLQRELQSAIQQGVKYRNDHTDPLRSLQFSADYRKLITCDMSSFCMVRSWPNGTVLFNVPTVGLPRTAVLSPDELTLAIVCDGNSKQPASRIELRDGNTGKLRRVLQSKDMVYTALVFLDEGTHIAVSSHSTGGLTQGRVEIWDINQDAPITTLKTSTTGHGILGALTLSPDRSRLYVGTTEPAIEVWDVASRKLLAKLTELRQPVCQLAVSSDGTTLASISCFPLLSSTPGAAAIPDRRLVLWDTTTFKLKNIIKEPTSSLITCLAFSPNQSQVLFTGSQTGYMQWWDANTSQLICEQAESNPLGFFACFSKDGNSVHLTTGKPDIATWTPTIPNLSTRIAEIWRIAISQDGKTLAIGADDELNTNHHSLYLNNTASPATTRWSSPGHQATVTAVAYSPEGQFLYTTGIDGKIKRWNASTMKIEWEVEAHTQRGIRELAVSPDGTLLATSGLDGLVILWDASTGKTFGKVPVKAGLSPIGLAFHPNQPWLAVAGGEVVEVWDHLRKKTVLQADQLGNVSCLAFDVDGERLYVGGKKPIIHVFDMVTKTLQSTLSTTTAAAIVVSPDNKTVASSSMNGEIRLWYAPTSQELATIKTSAQIINALVFSPDGRKLFAGSRDGKLMWWRGE